MRPLVKEVFDLNGTNLVKIKIIIIIIPMLCVSNVHWGNPILKKCAGWIRSDTRVLLTAPSVVLTLTDKLRPDKPWTHWTLNVTLLFPFTVYVWGICFVTNAPAFGQFNRMITICMFSWFSCAAFTQIVLMVTSGPLLSNIRVFALNHCF